MLAKDGYNEMPVEKKSNLESLLPENDQIIQEKQRKSGYVPHRQLLPSC